MSTDTTGIASLSVIGALIVALFAGGLYFANSGEEKAPLGMTAYQPTYQGGGKKITKKNIRVRKTRRNLY